MCNNKTRGFITTRTLIALLITLTILPLATTVFKYISNINFDYALANNEMALMDLRRIMLLAYDKKVDDYEINFIYKNDNYTLKFINNKLILQPGTQIFLMDIDEAHFEVKNESIYVCYRTIEGKEYERNIASQQGIYLADFLDNNDELFDDTDE